MGSPLGLSGLTIEIFGRLSVSTAGAPLRSWLGVTFRGRSFLLLVFAGGHHHFTQDAPSDRQDRAIPGVVLWLQSFDCKARFGLFAEFICGCEVSLSEATSA